MNNVEITGNLQSDPELRFTSNGPIASFSIANSVRLRDGSQGKTTWVQVEVWDKLAELVAENLSKGSFVNVSGRLIQKTFTDKETNKEKSRLIVRASWVWGPINGQRKSEPMIEQEPLFEQ